MIEANDLEYWASLGNIERVRAALVGGIDVNVRGEGGYTGLHAAAENNHLDVLRLLIEYGAEINPQLDTGQTPLDLAVLSGHDQAAEMLRERGGVAREASGGPASA